MSYVYIRSEPSLWTVGFYDPAGKWQPESDHDSADEAAARVAALNGGPRTPGYCDHGVRIASPFCGSCRLESVS